MEENLSLPIGVKPFRVRTREAWDAFLAGERELRALMDQKDREAVSEPLVSRCAELLSPAFSNPAFELGRGGEKYELILSPEGDRTRLFQLAGFVAALDLEGWARSGDPENACERWSAYQGEPSQAEDWAPRKDVYAGVTCCVPLINAYFQGDNYYMDRLHQDGVIPGFFYYPLDGVDRKDILDLRDQLEQAITARCGEGIVTFTGGSTGTSLGYLDFIAWDLKTLLDAAAEVFGGAPVDWAAFHTFRGDSDGIGLKQRKEA